MNNRERRIIAIRLCGVILVTALQYLAWVRRACLECFFWIQFQISVVIAITDLAVESIKGEW